MNVPLVITRTSIGAVMVTYGVSQIKNPASWFMYVPVWLQKLLPVKTESFMRSHGVVNVGLGMLFMSGTSVVYVPWATFAWWLSILPFAAMKDWRTGMRDFAITASVLAVALVAFKKSFRS